jgi:hypothetical protein
MLTAVHAHELSYEVTLTSSAKILWRSCLYFYCSWIYKEVCQLKVLTSLPLILLYFYGDLQLTKFHCGLLIAVFTLFNNDSDKFI